MIRKLQLHFKPSQLFKPWLDRERGRLKGEPSVKKRRLQNLHVKIGHGGTLDPLATGILVTGVGIGTKYLNDFLGCTKTYETVVLFGAETDTYDSLGTVVRRASYEHITREAVEKAIAQSFRGKLMQRPPIFSALRYQGKRLYEYAREGNMPPVEIQARPVEVTNMEILEWYPPGTQNDYKWPEKEMTGSEKAAAEQLLDKGDAEDAAKPTALQSPTKRKQPSTSPSPEHAEASGTGDVAAPDSKKQKNTVTTSIQEDSAVPVQETTGQLDSADSTEDKPFENKPSESVADASPSPPTVKISMTVTSGFYVRSFAHDLGKALGSCGLMSSLARTRQAEFSLDSDKVLEYSDLEAGEEVWGEKVRRFLEDWEAKKTAEQDS